MLQSDVKAKQRRGFKRSLRNKILTILGITISLASILSVFIVPQIGWAEAFIGFSSGVSLMGISKGLEVKDELDDEREL